MTGKKIRNKKLSLVKIVLVIFFLLPYPLLLKASEQGMEDNSYILQNSHLKLQTNFSKGLLVSEKITARKGSKDFFNGASPSLKSNGDFALKILWTAWNAPGKVNNADNEVRLSAKDFRLLNATTNQKKNGSQELRIHLRGIGNPFSLTLIYRLDVDAFFVKKKIIIRDAVYGYHFLQNISPIKQTFSRPLKTIKSGGFGQPVVLRGDNGGYFFGMEYPIAENTLKQVKNGARQITCSVEEGKKIDASPIESAWCIIGITPPNLERLWFSKYLETIRVAPLKPYTLYNSWYDLRAAEYPQIPKKNVMNEKNIRRIIKLIRENFVEKNDIHLDAFVLDDGWDVYKSDWRLRSEQFPHRLRPIADELKKMGTNLGLWFGPTGGYSNRNLRINWMKAHGYETVGKDTNDNNIMMCLAGKNYSHLFKKRVTDFVNKDGVRFFKWDGIQFSCSEPDHGHPIGVYSRRAVMDSLITIIKAVRAQHPNVFLNITSGTWLSPWWVQYANQIWMSGGDYGYSQVPSISQRDAAMTYRDLVLYQDFKINDLWFPIANLMTHGIIKGNLQNLRRREPIDKFMNNALLYFARGVSMWELYISPDILNENEWTSIAQSIHWAKANFDILSHTVMIGGNPGARQAYGYAHFKGRKGIIAVRNPAIESKKINVALSPAYNLDPDAGQLVLERIYPTRWISPHLYKANDVIDLELSGYETAVYELYPLKSVNRPLLAGVVFDGAPIADGNGYRLNLFGSSADAKILNPNVVESIRANGKSDPVDQIKNIFTAAPQKITSGFIKTGTGEVSVLKGSFSLNKTVSSARMALLLQSEPEKVLKNVPNIQITLNDQKLDLKAQYASKGWAWYTVLITSGKQDVFVKALASSADGWKGHASLWLLTDQKQPGTELVFVTKNKVGQHILPPVPHKPGLFKKSIKLTTGAIRIK